MGIKGPEDVAKMGIAEYNKQCRSIVMRYSNEWEVSTVYLTKSKTQFTPDSRARFMLNVVVNFLAFVSLHNK